MKAQVRVSRGAEEEGVENVGSGAARAVLLQRERGEEAVAGGEGRS